MNTEELRLIQSAVRDYLSLLNDDVARAEANNLPNLLAHLHALRGQYERLETKVSMLVDNKNVLSIY